MSKYLLHIGVCVSLQRELAAASVAAEESAQNLKLTQKQQYEHSFEPCVVCGDRASGSPPPPPARTPVRTISPGHIRPRCTLGLVD